MLSETHNKGFDSVWINMQLQIQFLNLKKSFSSFELDYAFKQYQHNCYQLKTLTWWDIYLILLYLGDIYMNADLAFINVNLNIPQAICKVAEDKKSIGVPGSEKKTEWKQILAWTSRNFKVTGGIEKDRHCMWLHTRKT